MGRTQQLLNSLQQKPLAPTYMISVLQVELTSLDSIYTSYKQPLNFWGRNLPSMEYLILTDVPGEAFYLS